MKYQIKNPELHRIALTAIIHKKKKYLIIQRSPNKNAFPGKWTVPGGGFEVEDYIKTPKTTPDSWYFAVTNSLKREIQEEVGLRVGELRYLLDLTFIRPDSTPVVILSYFCNWKSGKVVLNEENTNFAWVSYSEAKNYDLIEGILEEIKMVDQIIRGIKSNKEKIIANIKRKYNLNPRKSS